MQEAPSRTLLELRTLVPGSLAEALTVTDLQQTRDEVARTLRGNKVSLEYIRLKAFEQTLSNLGHNDPELASHLTTFYLEHRAPRDAQRVLPQQQSGLRAFFIAFLFREGREMSDPLPGKSASIERAYQGASAEVHLIAQPVGKANLLGV